MIQSAILNDGHLLEKVIEELQELSKGKNKFLVTTVPIDWVHPVTESGLPVPLARRENFESDLESWCQDCAQWIKGLRAVYTPAGKEKTYTAIEAEYKGVAYEDYAGPRPQESDYFPKVRPDNTAWAIYMPGPGGLGLVPFSPKFKNLGVALDWVNTVNIALGR